MHFWCPGVAQLEPLDEILGGNKIAEPKPTNPDPGANSTRPSSDCACPRSAGGKYASGKVSTLEPALPLLSRKTGLRCLSGAAAGAAAAPDPGVGGAMAEHVGADAQAGGRRKSVS